jgi:hypothetical protein
MQARKLSLPALLLLLLLAYLGSAQTGAAYSVQTGTAYSVPTSFSFQGYLVDSTGAPVTTSTSAPLQMRFGLFINGTRVWYAQYSAVNVIGGSFTVNLGADNNVAVGLDPVSGTTSGTVTPITPALLSTVTDQTPVAVQIQISNGDGTYDTLTPNVPVDSSLFALRSETVGGFNQGQLAKQDSSGDILDSNGNAVISSSGTWLGILGPEQGPQGPPGTNGTNGLNGATGATGQGFDFTGVWNSDSSYKPYDVATFDGSVWVVKPAGSPDGESPEADTVDWALFAPGFSYLGKWNSTATYYANDVVLYDGSVWIVKPNRTPNGQSPEVDTVDWALFTPGFSYLGKWNSTATYYANDVVLYDGSVWIVKPTGTPNGETPEVDTADWSLFTPGFSYLGQWGSTTYYANDVVLYNGSLYIATDTIDDGDGGLPPNQDSNWAPYTQGFNPTGVYDSSATYYLGDVVFYNNSS